MSQYFYDGQIKRYLTQFIRVMSNFSYKNSKGQLIRVPAMYGDMNRQVAQILRKNSENSIPTAPFIACYIKDLQFDISRLQDPTFISKVNIREREFDEESGQYLYTQGRGYTVERIMPSPFLITFSADIWATSTDQKMQLWEQIIVLFNPSLEIQTTDNYIDWTSLSALTLDSMTWSSRSIPQGMEQDIDICNLSFKAPIWITPPAKVKKLGIITKIITDVYEVGKGEIAQNYSDPYSVVMFDGDSDARIVITPGNFDLLVLDNVATLIRSESELGGNDTAIPNNTVSWLSILDHYPGKFRAGLSQLRLQKAGGNEVVAYISLDPNNDSRMALNFDADTIPANTIIAGRGSIDAIVNPETYAPPAGIIPRTRFLILENINVNSKYGTPGYSGPAAWKNSDGSDFQAYANDIIEWSGNFWSVIFNSSETSTVTYITNAYTGIQYKWSNNQWSKSFEGIYDRSLWRLVL
jgi:hypothetical protein